MLLKEQNTETNIILWIWENIVLMKKQSGQISLNQTRSSRSFLSFISNAVIFFRSHYRWTESPIKGKIQVLWFQRGDLLQPTHLSPLLLTAPCGPSACFPPVHYSLLWPSRAAASAPLAWCRGDTSNNTSRSQNGIGHTCPHSAAVNRSYLKDRWEVIRLCLCTCASEYSP